MTFCRFYGSDWALHRNSNLQQLSPIESLSDLILQPDFSEKSNVTEAYRGIAPLRLLLNQKNDPRLVERLKFLMDHKKERMEDLELWKSHKSFVEQFKK